MNILFFILKTKLLLKRVFGKETEMRTLLGTMNEEIEKMKKAVNIDYAPVTLDKSDKKVGLSFLGQRIFLVGKLSFKRIA